MTVTFSSKDTNHLLSELEQLLDWQLNDETISDWLMLYSETSAQLKDIGLEFELLRTKGIRNESDFEREEHFYNIVSPKYQTLDVSLNRKYLEEFDDLTRYPDLTKQFKKKFLIQDERIIDINLEEKDLINQYHDLSGSLEIDYNGSKNAAQIGKLLATSNSRNEREHVYRLCKTAELNLSGSIDTVFIRLIEARKKKAQLLGMKSYINFAWAYRTREYLPEQSIAWTKEIVKVFNPLYKLTCQKIADMHSVDELAPWDIVPDISIDKNLEEKDYKTILVNSFNAISKEFGEIITELSQKDSFDIMSTDKNSAVNFAYAYTNVKEIGIHANATSSVSNFRNLMHECGHAIHEYYAFENKLLWQKRASGEVAEFIAYTFQFLASDYLKSSGFLNEAQWAHYQLFVAKFILFVFWEDSGDEQLQQWLYKQDTIPTASEIDNKFLSVRSTPLKLDAEITSLQKKNWQTYHVIAAPFYSFDYSIALIGTLLCIKEMRRDKETFVKNLITVMKQGNRMGISDALDTLGVRFPYQSSDIEEASQVLLKEFLS